MNVPAEGVTGTVIRIRDDADHPIGVALDLWHLGTQWTDSLEPTGARLLVRARPWNWQTSVA